MPPDVVVLVCDTARADAFRPWGGPHPSPTMERLSHEGTRYARASSTAPWTVPAHASLFTGKLPTEHGVNGDGLQWVDRKPSSPAALVQSCGETWLPEAMSERGYRTWGASCNTWVSRWGGFDRGFEEFLDIRPWAKPRGPVQWFAFRAKRMSGMEDRGGKQAVDRFARRLAEAGPEPLFAFINLMETHSPFNPPGRYYPFPIWRRPKTFHLAGGPDQQLSYNAGVARPGDDYARTLRAIYFACGRYADEVLGRLISAIEGKGRPTVVVILSDHGENLGEHGLFNHNSSLHQTLLHIPMVVWGSKVDLAAGDIEEAVSSTGLAPWLTSVGEESVEPMVPDGAAVSEYEGTHRHNGIPDYIKQGIEERSPDVPPLVFHPGVAVRKGNFKFVAAGDGTASVFDLDADPGEERDLLPGNPGVGFEFQPFRREWEERRAERSGMRPVEPGAAAEGEIADHLRELGYIE
jgi:arylsulfatase A-like enzyme